MTDNKLLDQLKQTYLQTQPSKRLVKFGWVNLKILLLDKEQEQILFIRQNFARFMVLSITAFVVVFGSFFTLIQAAQAALPGEPLYPVKRLSETIVSTVSRSSQIEVENRASEILDISKKQNQSEFLDKTVEEYQKAVLEKREEISPSSKQGKEFRQKLETHEEQFRAAQKSSSSRELEKAIEVAKEGRSSPDGGDNKGDQKLDEERSGKGGGKESEDRSGSNSGSN